MLDSLSKLYSAILSKLSDCWLQLWLFDRNFVFRYIVRILLDGLKLSLWLYIWKLSMSY